MKAYASESYYIGVYLCGKEPDISAAFDFYAMQATSHKPYEAIYP